MATLYITEFAAMGQGANGAVVPVAGSVVANQTRTVSGTSAQSSAFNGRTRFVRLNSDTTCFVTFAASPTATNVMIRLVADQTEYFAVLPGDKLAAIT
jgi:hypothetical protein